MIVDGGLTALFRSSLLQAQPMLAPISLKPHSPTYTVDPPTVYTVSEGPQSSSPAKCRSLIIWSSLLLAWPFSYVSM